MARGQLSQDQRAEIFCNEYVIDFNGTRAAIKAGYAKGSAHVQSSRLLSKDKIQATIRGLLDKTAEKQEITIDRIMQEYGRLAFFDTRKLYDDEGVPIPIHKLDEDTARAITGVDITRTGDISITTKIKVADKKGALDSLSKTFGMFIEKIESTNNVTIDAITGEQLAMRIAFALKKVENSKKA